MSQCNYWDGIHGQNRCTTLDEHWTAIEKIQAASDAAATAGASASLLSDGRRALEQLKAARAVLLTIEKRKAANFRDNDAYTALLEEKRKAAAALNAPASLLTQAEKLLELIRAKELLVHAFDQGEQVTKYSVKISDDSLWSSTNIENGQLPLWASTSEDMQEFLQTYEVRIICGKLVLARDSRLLGAE
eukprot:GHVT01085407.1.p4 GENE.GHVT01085407.1~~GHVT01085407.1.p4  ORF type:complete len:189 (+),score=33.12 GHVT01085407.1:9738-10304(+)